jgi:hypothetical protein
MLTLGLTQTVGASLVHEFRLNGSRQQDTVRNTVNQSAGGDQPPDGLLFPPGFSLRDSNAILYSALPMDTEYSLGSKHFNVLGRYHFDVNDAVRRAELRPLRDMRAFEQELLTA